MNFQLRISHRAQRDVDEIFDWIAARSPEGAWRWFDAFHAAMRELQTRPLSYSAAPEAEAVGEELRQLSFKTRRGNWYRALFVLRGDVIHVASVRGAGQDLVTRDELDLPE